MRLAFLGTPDFAVPTLAAPDRRGPRPRLRLHPATGARGATTRPASVRRPGFRRRPGTACPRPGLDARAGGPGRVRGAGTRGRRRGGIRPDPHPVGAGGAQARQLQPARLFVAALAGGGADSARDHGWRFGDRRPGHAHDRGAGRRPGAGLGDDADRPRRHRRHAARPAGHAGGGAHGPDPGRSRAGRGAGDAAGHGGGDLRPQAQARRDPIALGPGGGSRGSSDSRSFALPWSLVRSALAAWTGPRQDPHVARGGSAARRAGRDPGRQSARGLRTGRGATPATAARWPGRAGRGAATSAVSPCRPERASPDAPLSPDPGIRRRTLQRISRQQTELSWCRARSNGP